MYPFLMRDYDSTVARMAGNIAAGLACEYSPLHLDEPRHRADITRRAVQLARELIDEVKRTQPVSEQPSPRK